MCVCGGYGLSQLLECRLPTSQTRAGFAVCIQLLPISPAIMLSAPVYLQLKGYRIDIYTTALILGHRQPVYYG